MNEQTVLSATYLVRGALDRREDFIKALERSAVSEMDMIAALISQAKGVEAVAEYVSENYDFSGVWLYEVVEPFGEELIKFHDVPDKFLASDVLALLLNSWLRIDESEKNVFIDTIKFLYQNALA
ncbi:hypothetical protein ACU75N_003990 [Yersinia enterocolitica]|uniref:Uncharacterized protein n=1 Tax=Yersinia intermedia TaxID=631 RepID=A0A0T9MUK1_YERIN|nr:MULTISPECIES: hypothetical protein [Yersinia]EKN6368096.1 hypothetical protein [Yersinia enterocolitica]OVZ88211.1 hypothetical protein CBW58_19930 [Yersinia frederiksenii]EKN3347681.1 hypothetical protein [Yersinia ruckeri]EKN4700069.1 hypothetical protein [Yersinia ruckeri]ELM3741028.1 hypothetical protein [Yersinia ruckeri]